MGEWRKEKLLSIFKSNGEKWVVLTVIAAILAAIGLALVLTVFNINVFKPTLKPSSFEERSGVSPKFGTFSVKVATTVTIGPTDHVVPPAPGCLDMMVMDVEFWITTPSSVREALMPENPTRPRRIKSAEAFGQRIVIHRACIADEKRPFGSFSSWNQIWEEVSTDLNIPKSDKK